MTGAGRAATPCLTQHLPIGLTSLMTAASVARYGQNAMTTTRAAIAAAFMLVAATTHHALLAAQALTPHPTLRRPW